MLDSDGSPQRIDRHHRRCRSSFPVFRGCAGETPSEREERRLAEAAALVRPPAEQPLAAPSDPEPPAPVPVPGKEAAPAAQAVAPAAPPAGGAPDAPPDRPHGAATAALAGHAAAPGTPPARGSGPARA